VYYRELSKRVWKNLRGNYEDDDHLYKNIHPIRVRITPNLSYWIIGLSSIRKTYLSIRQYMGSE